MLRFSANENAIRNALSQNLSFPAPLDKGNLDSGNEIANELDYIRSYTYHINRIFKVYKYAHCLSHTFLESHAALVTLH